MTCTELIAESWVALFFRLPTVGIAISIRMAMMAITISNSISVKPLGFLPSLVNGGDCAPRRPRQNENLRFMGFQCLVEQAGRRQPIRQNATTYRRGREMGRSKAVVSEQLSVVSSSRPAVVAVRGAFVALRIFPIKHRNLFSAGR